MKIIHIAALTLPLFATPAFADPAELAKQGGCLTCHSVERKIVGPSFKEIAARYKGNADAVTQLAGKVRQGSSGVWGKAPMPPTPATRLDDAGLKSVLEWALQQ